MKVFFDVITNHTADVIDYEEGEYDYRARRTCPYVDADGTSSTTATTRAPALPAARPRELPVHAGLPDAADETVKAPAWLNDPTMYHNRGDSTFAGENSVYGDFFGLDDLFTERPEVVDGMIDIYQTWVTEVGIDGFRIDTVKHVNMEFWQQFGAGPPGARRHRGQRRLLHVRRGLRLEPGLHVAVHDRGQAPGHARLPLPGARAAASPPAAATDGLRDLFAQDDYYTDADSNAYSLPTFLGNHDMGRIGNFLAQRNPGATDAELLARDQLAHALMFLVRGMPVVYYGDEQGFTGDGGDKDARQDMLPSQVASYNDDDLIGTDATTADANFDETHPLYAFLASSPRSRPTTWRCARRAGPALLGATAGVYAFSRIDARRGGRVRRRAQQRRDGEDAAIPTYSAGAGSPGLAAGGSRLTRTARASSSITVPPLSAVVYRADAPLAADSQRARRHAHRAGRRPTWSARSRSAPRSPTAARRGDVRGQGRRRDATGR